jgi:hypothetical protein
MVRDPRNLDQNPVVIDPAKVDAVLKDRPTSVTNPMAPPDDVIEDDGKGEPRDRHADRPPTRRPPPSHSA